VWRQEVDPERINVSVKETEAIAKWFSSASALYMLWLNSGEYEEYAKARLLNPNGQINKEGRKIAKDLSKRIPTQLWILS